VDVPPGTETLTVTLSYDRSAGVLDLGCAGPAGFRGWSGGARSTYGIGRAAATPGYLPGPMEPGTWQVLLGLHQVGPAGIGWEVTVEIGRAPLDPPGWTPEPSGRSKPPARDRPYRSLPAADGLRWLAGDLHTHSVHSDGALTLDELGALAYERGLDFLAVTDHNTVSQHLDLAAAAAHADIILLRGQELTTDRGHANYLGGGWADFRAPADAWLAAAEAAGALLSINHPLWRDCAWQMPMQRKPPLVEVWHSTWDGRSDDVLEWWRAWGAAGVPVGGSDFHRPGWDAPPGWPTTWVEVEDDDVLGAVAAGRVAISTSPGGPVVVRHSGELVVLDGEDAVLVGVEGVSRRIGSDRARLAGARGPHRVVDRDGQTLALTP
jgi:hypothetical protein